MAKILSVYNRLQAGNWGKRRESRLTQFIHAMLQLSHALVVSTCFRTALTEAHACTTDGCSHTAAVCK